MPIYEYRCSSCGHQQEYLLKVSDAPRTTCPSCGKESLTKMVTAAGFQLKGSGWYATDFKGRGSKPSTTRASGEGTSGGDANSGGDATSGAGSKAGADSRSGSDSKSGNAAPEGKKEATGSKAGSGGGSS